ncbi:unnamed protein product [Thelazia callipaeda]|uniref:Gal_mutarotas_2 domain-containing protein n=1 Tax=Thelazia callipaeda TaxID=103827 RepID=A0A158RAV8_THECL|nr:unnamed protein product [Thelazia callipaeda]
MPRASVTSDEKLKVEVDKTDENIFFFRILRNSTGIAIWDTSIGGLLFAHQYIQIATFLPTRQIYGIGEHQHLTLMHDLSKYQTWPMFGRDQASSVDNPHGNLYGVHPFYICLENDGKAHGVFILNSNAQEVTFGPAPHLIYRTIGGMLDITFFPGPQPEDVIKQYTAFIGKPFLPAYFALGFQLCRYGYKNLEEMESVVSRVQKAGIPLDTTYADIDYMNRYQDFTIAQTWQGLSDYVDKLHENELNLFLIFDPAVQIDSAAFKNACWRVLSIFFCLFSLNQTNNCAFYHSNYYYLFNQVFQNAGFIEWQTMDDVQERVNYDNYSGSYDYVTDTKIMISVVWPDWYVAFPDFSNNKTIMWWNYEMGKMYQEIKFDGIWLDMNEPAVFGTNEEKPWYFDQEDRPVKLVPLWCPLNNSWDDPPYKTYGVYGWGNTAQLCSKTLCMNAVTNDGKQLFYNTKSLYGIWETVVNAEAFENIVGKRRSIITRSTFPSSGHYSGHWLGDNTSGWKWLQASIIGMIEFNIFGIPYVGADICGFSGNTTEELCLRWSQLGAFYPFSRNHNTKGARPQDPAEWPAVARAARQALLFRYHYLPYLYSLMFECSLNGGTVVRPLFFEFPNDSNTYQLDYQFMWGSAMVFVPVVYEYASTVHGYLPPTALWYSLRESDYGMKVCNSSSEYAAPITDMMPVFVRGGYIVPRQKAETTSAASRRNPFELLIAPNSNGEAEGLLYWDDGISVVKDIHQYKYYKWIFHYIADRSEVRISISTQTSHVNITFFSDFTVNRSCKELAVPSLDIIDIISYQCSADFSTATINGIRLNISADAVKQIKAQLYIKSRKLIDLSSQKDVLLKWSHDCSRNTNSMHESYPPKCVNDPHNEAVQQIQQMQQNGPTHTDKALTNSKCTTSKNNSN